MNGMTGAQSVAVYMCVCVCVYILFQYVGSVCVILVCRGVYICDNVESVYVCVCLGMYFGC